MELDGGVGPPARVGRGPSRRLSDFPTVERLEVYERHHDGHTISRHCDRRPGDDVARLQGSPSIPATGSFTSVAEAQRAVEDCVAANRADVVGWLGGAERRLAIEHDCGRVVGTVLRRSQWLAGDSAPAPATTCRVVLRRSPSYQSGFSVLTAYPVTTDPARRTLP